MKKIGIESTIGFKFNLNIVYLRVKITNMILKIFRAVWFLSMLAVLGNLLYVYAGLPEAVTVYESEGTPVSINKESLFYGWLILLAIVNAMVYFFSKSLVPNEELRTWFTGLIVCINVFFVIGFSFIGLYNSTENFDFSRVGFVLNVGIGLIGLWLLSWPIFSLYRKFSSK